MAVADEGAAKLAEQLGVPVEEIPAMLADDRALDGDGDGDEENGPDGDEGEEEQGALLRASTLENYVAGVAELYNVQVSLGTNKHPPWRGAALKAMMHARQKAQDRHGRESYADRGEGGIQAGYTPEEFMRMQEFLLTRSAVVHQVKSRRPSLPFISSPFPSLPSPPLLLYRIIEWRFLYSSAPTGVFSFFANQCSF